MNNSDICRETLAKLMANENLSVTHSPRAKTASFDVKSRNLILPVWKDSDESVYTLLISHEVGHALYTPFEELMSALNENAQLKHIINVVEDVRIEKLIQKKYPGIKYQFKRGYMFLFNNNFFGTKDRDESTYNLLDRLNIHFKVGGFGWQTISFTPEESQWVDKIHCCETFSDVVRVSKELLNYIKDSEDFENNNTNQQSTEQSAESSNVNSESTEVKQQSESTDNESNHTSPESSSEDNISVEPEESQENSTTAPTNNSTNIESETQNSLETNISNSLIDQCEKYVKLKIPNINFTKYIVDYKTIHKKIDEYYKSKAQVASQEILQAVQKFKASVALSVNSMANIFEMKKRASLYTKSKTDKTGQIDMNKVHSYRYNDNIFKRITVVPEGKSHGMVMFFDMSSSMEHTISSCIEQILVLCMFCKKINIPFDVYGFSDSESPICKSYHEEGSINTLHIDKAFKFRHYMSSKMTNIEYEKAFFNMIQLSTSYSNSFFWPVPPGERLCSTPLVPCILMSKNVISAFKNAYNLDIVNAIYLTDGDDTHGILGHDYKEPYKRKMTKIVLTSDKTNKDYVAKLANEYTSVKNLFKIVKDETGANIISFYLLHGSIERHKHILDGKVSNDDFSKFFKDNNFYYFSKHLGYDSYYIIKSKSLSISDNDSAIEIDSDFDIDVDDEKVIKQNIKKIVKSFDKTMTNSVKNKMFLNKFIEQIS
ncbi:MAG: hypothetical protein ACK5GV_08605 [Bacteroidota bacterium]|jgi:hypothetical protein